MIEKMKMVYVVSSVSQKDEMLDGLRNLGILHLSEKKSTDRAVQERLTNLSKTASALMDYATDKKSKNKEKIPILSDEQFEELYQSVCAAMDKKSTLTQEISAANTEIERIRAWGEFVPGEITQLKEAGYDLHFYRMGKNEYALAAQDEEIRMIRLKSIDKMDTVAVIGTLPATIPAAEFVIPEKGVCELRKEIESAKQQIASCDEVLKKAVAYESSFQVQMLKAQNAENYFSASESTGNDDDVVWIEPGFFEKMVDLDASEEAGIYFKNGGTDKVSINSKNASKATVTVNGENMGAVMPVNFGTHANNDAALICSKVTLIGSKDAVRIIITDRGGETVYLDRTVSGFFNIDNIGFYAREGWNSFAYVDDVECWVAEIPVTIGDSGKATFCSDIPLDFSKGEVTAYVASSATGTEVTLSKVEAIPALTGVYLKAAPGKYGIAVPAEATTPAINYLKGVITSTVVNQTEGENTNFFLSAEGFKKAVASSTLAAGKAYLSLPTSMFTNGVNVLSIMLDDATAIEETLVRPAENGVLYDLSGRRIEQPKRGIYIQGGKKVLFK